MKLPSGWAAGVVGDVAEFVRGIAFPSSDKRFEPGTDLIACLRTANVQDEIDWTDLWYIPERHVKSDVRRLRVGDILMSTANSQNLVGKVAPVRALPLEATLGAFISVIRARAEVSREFLFYKLRSAEVQRALRATASQTTNIANISASNVLALPMALPPLNEQRRIVAKLDAIFDQTRAAKARLERLPALLDKLKRSILAAAFRGDLTADWRAAHPNVEPASTLLERGRAERRALWEEELRSKGRDPSKAKYIEVRSVAPLDLAQLPTSWCWTTLGYVAPLQAGYAFSSAGFRKSGVRLLKGINVRDGWLATDEVDYWDADDCEKYKPFRLQAGDLVLAMDRPVYSSGSRATKVAQLGQDWDGSLLLQRVGRFRRIRHLRADYLMLFLQSAMFREHLIREQNGTQDGKDLPHVSAGVVDGAALPFPPEGEQALIAERANALLASLRNLELAATRSASRLTTVEQAALTKALQGELVDQDPNDEPAAVALERIRAATTSLDQPVRTRRISAPSPRTKESRRAQRSTRRGRREARGSDEVER